MRQSTNEEINGVVQNGFDYDLQVWIMDYIIQACGHSRPLEHCNGCKLVGQDIRGIKTQRVKGGKTMASLSTWFKGYIGGYYSNIPNSPIFNRDDYFKGYVYGSIKRDKEHLTT